MGLVYIVSQQAVQARLYPSMNRNGPKSTKTQASSFKNVGDLDRSKKLKREREKKMFRVGEKMEEALAVVRFDELPSPEDFSSQIESRNVPAVFHGCIKNWKAFCNWNPSNGGLDYLQELVGSSVVEAMLSRSAPVFYGDIRSHEMVPLPFSTFITSCKLLHKSDDGHGVSVDSKGLRLSETTEDEASFASASSSHQVYLAQVPISNVEDNERSQLETLRGDIQMPKILETKTLSSINLWMNSAKSRSSTHYDPHHNLLCVVAGCKQVVLWPPSASPSLYPMPIYGEASNHSSVDLENPDFSTHSRAKNSMEYSQYVILQAGDALFIPEGWYHQVDSDDLTIAVNFWWQSCIMSSISQHMDAYYIRRITRRLVDVEMDQMLHPSADRGKSGEDKFGKLAIGESGHLKHDMDEQRKDDDLEVTRNKHRIMLKQLDPLSLQSLLELVSLVHDGVSTAGQSEQMQSTLVDPTTLNLKGECKKIAKASSFNLEDDPVAKTLWTLEPLKLQNVLLAMVHNFPRTVEALILHMLSPLAAEVLTRKFEEMDQRTRKEDRDEFYLVFYGVFDDQSAAMDAILSGKEAFARQAFQNVLDKYLGVNVDG